MQKHSKQEKNKIAERILQANSALQAKIEAKALPYNSNWTNRKESVMLEILSEKMKSCKDFCEDLMNADEVLDACVPGDL